MQTDYRDIIFATVYFLLSILVTGWFIEYKFLHFISPSAILLCNVVAAGKWIIHVAAALALLKTKRWAFIRRLGFACLISSCMFFLWFVIKLTPIEPWNQFKCTLMCSVLAMLILYYKAVIDTGISMKWYIGWLVCLVISIGLQTHYVFP